MMLTYGVQARVEAEVVSKTFAVYSVVDQRKKNRLPFSEAVKLQLLDKETGTYWHNVTGEKVSSHNITVE